MNIFQRAPRKKRKEILYETRQRTLAEMTEQERANVQRLLVEPMLVKRGVGEETAKDVMYQVCMAIEVIRRDKAASE